MTRATTILACSLLAAACSNIGDAWKTGWSRHSAADQIMLVSNTPSTLGHRRLESQSRNYGDLGRFLSQRGWPDFLAETDNDGRRYLILYYLDRRQAFAARTQRPDDFTMEFAGPYPITEREFTMLRGLRRQFDEQSKDRIPAGS